MSGIAIDTNIWVRMASPSDPQSRVAKAAVDVCFRKGAVLTSDAVGREFLAVLTRKVEQNGLGRSSEEAIKLWNFLTVNTLIVHGSPAADQVWQRLIQTHGITGFRVHDAYHVAVALTHGATRFLTFDQEDFAPFAAEIQLIHPNDLAGTQDLA